MGRIRETRVGYHALMLEIDNPPANALGSAMRAEMLTSLARVRDDESVRCLIITGTGASFCSGDDLKEQQAAQAAGIDERKRLLSEFAVVLEAIEALRVPVIAAINGWALGGGLELALSCDIRIASHSARFVCAGVNVGLMASAWRLPRLIGVARAKHMLLTGLPFDARTAERFGLVTEVHGDAELPGAAHDLALRIASRAPLSVEATKRLSSRAPDLSQEEAAAMNQAEVDVLVRSADHAEALTAFSQKREPKFTRR